MKYLWLGLLLGTVVAANWALATFGIIPIGFGLMAPAGVLFAGLAFTFRDMLHDAAGRWWVLGAIVLGAALSGLLEDGRQFALASGTAFLASELADFAVYSPLRRRTWIGAVALSNSVGLAVDSALFLWLAFGSLAFLPGQIIGKAYMTLLAIVILWGVRRVVLSRHTSAAMARAD